MRVLQTRNHEESKRLKCREWAEQNQGDAEQPITEGAKNPRCAGREIQDRSGAQIIFVRLRQEDCRLDNSLGNILRAYNELTD